MLSPVLRAQRLPRSVVDLYTWLSMAVRSPRPPSIVDVQGLDIDACIGGHLACGVDHLRGCGGWEVISRGAAAVHQDSLTGHSSPCHCRMQSSVKSSCLVFYMCMLLLGLDLPSWDALYQRASENVTSCARCSVRPEQGRSRSEKKFGVYIRDP